MGRLEGQSLDWALHLAETLKKANSLEMMLAPPDNASLEKFFLAHCENPSAEVCGHGAEGQVTSLLNTALDRGLAAVQSGPTGATLDPDTRAFAATDADAAKQFLLDVLLRRKDLLRSAWGGRVLQAQEVKDEVSLIYTLQTLQATSKK